MNDDPDWSKRAAYGHGPVNVPDKVRRPSNMTDDELLGEWKKFESEADPAWEAALAREIERRGLDI